LLRLAIMVNVPQLSWRDQTPPLPTDRRNRPPQFVAPPGFQRMPEGRQGFRVVVLEILQTLHTASLFRMPDVEDVRWRFRNTSRALSSQPFSPDEW
jgi:hypothetical protein